MNSLFASASLLFALAVAFRASSAAASARRASARLTAISTAIAITRHEQQRDVAEQQARVADVARECSWSGIAARPRIPNRSGWPRVASVSAVATTARLGKFGTAIQRCLAPLPARRGVREFGVDAARPALLLDPCPQPPPSPDEALVRDVDVLLRVDDDKRAPLGGERRDHVVDDGGVGRRHRVRSGPQRDRRQLTERRRTADLAVLGIAIGQLLKNEARDVAMVVGRQRLVDLLGMAVEGVPQRFDRRLLVVRQVDRLAAFAGARARRPTSASARAGAPAADPDPAAGARRATRRSRSDARRSRSRSRWTSRGRDLRAADRHRALDGRSQLRARHPRHQELAVVQRFRQSGELRAIAEVVRSHRQHDVDGNVLLLRRIEEQIDARGGLLARIVGLSAIRPKRNSLLELVGDDEQAVAGVGEQLPRGGGQPEAARIEQRADLVGILVGRAARRAGGVPRARASGSRPDRCPAERSRCATKNRRTADSLGRAPAGARRAPATTCRCPTSRRRPPAAAGRGASADRRIVRRGRKTTRTRAARRAAARERGCPDRSDAATARRRSLSCGLPESLDKSHQPRVGEIEAVELLDQLVDFARLVVLFHRILRDRRHRRPGDECAARGAIRAPASARRAADRTTPGARSPVEQHAVALPQLVRLSRLNSAASSPSARGSLTSKPRPSR